MNDNSQNRTDSKVTIKIPRVLYDRLTRIVEDSGFNSVTDFIVYVLRDLASSEQSAYHDDETALSKQEIEAIRKRLRTLGYL
ncbi:CopG family transcriptional regulator [candidate division KSB1 bacterium]|nr:CopG family transcriptional regulator [candidate division KSB1 bacterium]